MFHIYVVFARLVPEGKISYHRLLDFIRESFAREQRFKYYGNNSRIIAHFSEEFL